MVPVGGALKVVIQGGEMPDDLAWPVGLMDRPPPPLLSDGVPFSSPTEHCVFCRFLSDGNSYKDVSAHGAGAAIYMPP